MGCFSQSEFQVLRDVSAKVHNLEDEARSVLASRIVMNHKVNLFKRAQNKFISLARNVQRWSAMHRLLCPPVV